MSKPVNFSSESLYESACFYHSLGWSVIPLHGDKNLEKPKAAAVPWAVYQQERATKETLSTWFLSGQFTSMGIVCGPVSELVVLDFDDAQFAAAFQKHCPDLIETLTVRSGGRGLPHYYYHVNPRTKVLNKRLNGADLQAKGRYVVAPPSVIQGRAWQVVNGVAPLTLSNDDLQRIESFLETYAYIQGESKVRSDFDMPEFSPQMPSYGDLGLSTGGSSREAQLSAEKAVRWYQGKARQGSRNEALFSTALYVRHYGWTQAQALAILTPAHCVQSPTNAHRTETLAQRQSEAEKTINSAYRYSLNRRAKPQQRQLPNSLREHLLQQGLAPVARVLEGLLLKGIGAGKVFTERQVTMALKDLGIGRRSVLKALQFLKRSDSQRLKNTDQKGQKRSKKCLFVIGAKRVRILKTAGHPPQYYRMPEMLRLCRVFGVENSFSDVLPVAALRSPKAYREALQQALFQRRPGVYSRGWLAGRLGVSVWTSRRYDSAIKTHIQARYDRQVIHWGNVGILEEESGPPRGVFLEAPTGKHYPPLRGVAVRLLRQFHQLILKRRTWNHYAVGAEIGDEHPVHSVQKDMQKCAELCNNLPKTVQKPFISVPELLNEEDLDGFWLCPDCLHFHICPVPPKTCKKCQAEKWQLIPKSIWQDVERCKAWWGALKRAKRAAQPKRSLALGAVSRTEPVPQTPTATSATTEPVAATENGALPQAAAPHYEDYLESTVEKLYQRVYAMNPEHSLTRAQARQLVEEFGVTLVVSVTGKLLGRRLHNPAGFVVSTLRDMARPDNVSNNAEAFMASIQESGMGRYIANWEE